MEKRFKLAQYGPHLWTREKARQIRGRVAAVLETLETGGVLVIDAAGVEAFDFSFATELFGKTLLTLGSEYPGRFVIAENLNECTHENLGKGLESLNLTMIQRSQGQLKLLGKVHPADEETFAQIVGTGEAVSAGALSKKLEVNLTAMNERLSKLTNLGVVRREKGSSAAGREQYVYRVLN
jgi:predicted transcriptional regulator